MNTDILTGILHQATIRIRWNELFILMKQGHRTRLHLLAQTTTALVPPARPRPTTVPLEQQIAELALPASTNPPQAHVQNHLVITALPPPNSLQSPEHLLQNPRVRPQP